MSILAQINIDLKAAMRLHEREKVNTLRLITAAVKQVEVDERIVVNDERLLAILIKLAKQREESITQFKIAARQDLIEQEQFELQIIKTYLPEILSAEEVDNIITETLANFGIATSKDMGKIMTILKSKLQGRTDLGKVSALVKSKLA